MAEQGNTPQNWKRIAQLAELGLLSASLMHELRQHVFALKSHAELAGLDAPAPISSRLAAILGEVEAIEDLMRHYGALCRDDTGPGLFDMHAPVRSAVALLESRARRGGVALELKPAPAALWMQGREGALRQITLNLVGNAIDAVSGCARKRVEVCLASAEGGLELVVADTGAGIPAQTRARVFEPFVTTKSVGQGTGLGLHITRELVDEAHGRIALEDNPGGGTLARVWLPTRSE